jgi:DNA-binding NarL/FixJ family response regulator
VKLLLLVENRPLFREGLALLLEWSTGFNNLQAGSLAEAGRLLFGPQHGKIGLVIVDIDLPDGDGVELIERLREGQPEVAVLALTAGRDLGRRVQALDAGADEVLFVGAPIEELVDAAKRLGGAYEKSLRKGGR